MIAEEQVHVFMSLMSPKVLWAIRLSNRAPMVVSPFSMLNGNLRFPKVLDVEPKPANDLVLESTQGKLKPKALKRLSANLPQAVLWQVELQPSSRAPHMRVSEGSHILTRGRLSILTRSPLEVDPAPAMLRGNTIGWLFHLPLGPCLG